ncbi:MAG: hypothetical protein R6U96_13365 [Promethearchaeia archaeon]
MLNKFKGREEKIMNKNSASLSGITGFYTGSRRKIPAASALSPNRIRSTPSPRKYAASRFSATSWN